MRWPWPTRNWEMTRSLGTFYKHPVFLSILAPFSAMTQTNSSNRYFPSDHTHTSPAGADMVAQAFAQAIATAENGTTSLVDYIVSDYATVY